MNAAFHFRTLIFGAALALVGAGAHAQPKKIAFTLPEENQAITHEIVDGSYQVRLSVQRGLTADKEVEFLLASHGPGTWKVDKVKWGKFVEAKFKPEDLNVKPPTPDKPFVAGFKLRFVPDPDAPDKLYDQEAKEAQKAADNEAPNAGAVQRDALFKKHLSARIAEQNRKGSKGLLVLPPPKFIGLTTDQPESMMRDLCVWRSLDVMLNELGAEVPPGSDDKATLELWNFVTGAMFGRIKRVEEMPSELRESFEDLKLAPMVILELGFEPHLVDKKPDRLWSAAPVVASDDKDFPAVRFEGSVGGDDRAAAWLALEGKSMPEKLLVESELNSASIVWTQVKGEDGRKYLRVVPKDRSQPTPFRLVVRRKDNTEPAATVTTTPPPAKVRFPF